MSTIPQTVWKKAASAAATGAFLFASAGLVAAQELNALIWCDHADPTLLQPFEEANQVKVNVKEFEGTGAGLAIVEQSQPGDWDGRIAIYDYYLPVIGMAALALGKKTPELTETDLPAIKDVLLKMKANAKLVGEIVASQTALATGEVDIIVGGGEFVTAGLAKENPAMDFTIPKEGAVLWSQSLAMFKDSKNKDLALKFIQYIMSPEGQARLATSSCYWGMPANTKAALTDEQKKTLRFNEQPGFLARAQPYPAPDADLDKKMQDAWTEMMQAH